ncbi:hypothetical protein IE53DRAFT_368027 [Violaceomyces palustris]|uniref:Uncharacterized protein n=1 Tax=Violaceomyces palustris TaxID=1673888 RepID=A0ACD0P045_9BASI|nr:hypothetical protein IE53DRAFT_368027 [Violaceomyces palustris]
MITGLAARDAIPYYYSPGYTTGLGIEGFLPYPLTHEVQLNSSKAFDIYEQLFLYPNATGATSAAYVYDFDQQKLSSSEQSSQGIWETRIAKVDGFLPEGGNSSQVLSLNSFYPSDVMKETISKNSTNLVCIFALEPIMRTNYQPGEKTCSSIPTECMEGLAKSWGDAASRAESAEETCVKINSGFAFYGLDQGPDSKCGRLLRFMTAYGVPLTSGDLVAQPPYSNNTGLASLARPSLEKFRDDDPIPYDRRVSELFAFGTTVTEVVEIDGNKTFVPKSLSFSCDSPTVLEGNRLPDRQNLMSNSTGPRLGKNSLPLLAFVAGVVSTALMTISSV